jgi:hypothetical protein
MPILQGFPRHHILGQGTDAISNFSLSTVLTTILLMVHTTWCGFTGFAYDRNWVIVLSSNGKFQTQRQLPT